MRLVSYRLTTVLGESVRIGALVNNRVIDLNLAYVTHLAASGATGRPYEVAAGLLPPDMLAFLTGGKLAGETADAAIKYVTQRLERGEAVTGPRGEKVIYDRKEIKLLAPVPRPNSIRDTMSFEGHLRSGVQRRGKTMPEEWYQIPFYYKGNPGSVIGTEEPIWWPAYAEKLDYELEFGIYIGKKGKNIKAEDAPEYIAGYTIFNDISARDIQEKERALPLGPTKGKDFDHGNVMGPCMVTPDELDPRNLRMTAKINGETWSDGTSADMYWDFPRIIAYISAEETLYPGDFIASGTVGGGCGHELGRWIQPGDVIELEVEGIGVLRNQVLKTGGATSPGQ
ncbi:MAG: fumarylacetoacetate hydrolase family protein [Chloroflexota bacterium]